METVLERGDAVVKEPRRAAPDGDVAMAKRISGDRIAALQAAELEDGQQPERDRDDRLREIALVPVLMQRQPGTRLVAVDQAGVRREVLIARFRGGLGREAQKKSGMSGQGLPVSGSLRS